MASESSFAVQSESNLDKANTDSRVLPSNTPRQTKKLFVPIPKKRLKKDTTTSLLKEAVTAFHKYAYKDPSAGIIDFLKEENGKFGRHGIKMMEIQMHLFHTTMGYSNVFFHNNIMLHLPLD